MERNSLLKALIIGLSIIITAAILGRAFKNRNQNLDSISVVGLGSKTFVSDEIRFSGSFSVNHFDIKEAYSLGNQQREKVKNFFISKGFSNNEISFSGMNFEKEFKKVTVEKNDEYVKSEDVFNGYTASQSVTIKSSKNPELMKRIEKVSDQTSELVNQGVEFQTNAIQYTYTDLPSLKYNLIEAASSDALERAEKIVKKGNGKLGKLKNASMGVFQITGAGKNEEDSYGGNFDVYSKVKDARITVRLEYELN